MPFAFKRPQAQQNAKAAIDECHGQEFVAYGDCMSDIFEYDGYFENVFETHQQ